MSEIIPAIIATSYEDLEAKVRKLEPYTDRVQLDIMDGKFVPEKTISGYEELAKLQTSLQFDVHLMIEDPASQMFEWYQRGVGNSFFIHAEVQNGLKDLFEQLKLNLKSTGLVFNPETRPEDFQDLLKSVDYVQFMTVHPGKYGGEFLPEVLGKVSDFRDQHPQIPIVIDGGMNPETGREALLAGASYLVVGSYLQNSADIGTAIQAMKDL